MRWQSCWLYRIEFRVLYGSLCLLLPSASLRKTIVLWFSLLFQLVSMRYSHTYRRLKTPDWESIVLLWCFWEISHLSEPGIAFCCYMLLIILGRSQIFICFSRYFLLFIFFQPCPARVAVPCPSAFAPGKFVLVHHVSRYSVIRNSGIADQFALWGSPSWLPSTSMTWCISWLGYLIVHVIHVPFSFIKHLFSGCFPLRERPLYAISDGEIDPVEVGAPVFGTLADYAEFRRMRHNKTLHR